MTTFTLTPTVGARAYCYFGGKGKNKQKITKDKLIEMVLNNNPYLHAIDGVVESIYKYRGTRTTFSLKKADGSFNNDNGVWGKSGWHFIFVKE